MFALNEHCKISPQVLIAHEPSCVTQTEYPINGGEAVAVDLDFPPGYAEKDWRYETDDVDLQNWEDSKAQKRFAKMEALFLAGKLTPDQKDIYRSLLHQRRAFAFSKNYLRNYAESERLRKLAKKLKEIQQFLKPIRL